MSSKKLSRRNFMSRTAKVAAGVVIAPNIITSAALGNASTPAASERIALGFIGVGGRGGGSLLPGFLGLPDSQCIAVCDCFEDRRNAKVQQVNKAYADLANAGSWNGCDAYGDFRELLERDDIDAVVIATPDHWHVPVALAATRAGKDVYVEKPLGLCMNENKAMRKAVHRYGNVFQYGTQQRSNHTHCAFACELVRNGHLGEIKEIHVTSPYMQRGTVAGSTKEIPVPEGFDYDMWLGPAPRSPYTKDRCTRWGSWHVYDNSIGFLGGYGAHPLDIMHWGYPQIPVEYEGTGEIQSGGLFDTAIKWDIHGRFANDVKFTFKGLTLDTSDSDTVKFVGENGWVAASRDNIYANPKSLLTTIIKPGDTKLLQGNNHCQNFLDAIKARSNPASPIDSAVQSDYISHLSDIALRTGRKITWDPEKEEIVGDAEATRMMARPMRSPWRL